MEILIAKQVKIIVCQENLANVEVILLQLLKHTLLKLATIALLIHFISGEFCFCNLVMFYLPLKLGTLERRQLSSAVVRSGSKTHPCT